MKAQLEAVKAQRALENTERLEREVQRRADEMYARRLAEEERRHLREEEATGRC